MPMNRQKGREGRERRGDVRISSVSEWNRVKAVLEKTNLRRTRWPNTFELKHTPPIVAAYTELRNEKTGAEGFRRAGDEITWQLTREILGLMHYWAVKITTPLGRRIAGVKMDTRICAVPVFRAGRSMSDVFGKRVPKVAVFDVVIQRNEETAEPIVRLNKLPQRLPNDIKIVLLDPMLATGGSASTAIDLILATGAKEEQIVFPNIVSCPEGIQRLMKEHPRVTVVTGWIDEGLNDKFYIVPGLGDYGDRYYHGTTIQLLSSLCHK